MMPRHEGSPDRSVDVCQCLSSREARVAGHAYATEEMPYKYYQDPARTILIVGIQALESVLLPILVQHGQVGDLLQVSFGGRIVVDLDIAFEVGGRVFNGHAF